MIYRVWGSGFIQGLEGLHIGFFVSTGLGGLRFWALVGLGLVWV